MTDRPNLPPRYGRPIERDHAVVQEGAAPGSRRAVALGDVAEIVMGQSPPGDSVSADHGVPLLNGPTEFGAHHPTPQQSTTDPRKLARAGDLLFCVRGSTTGRMNWADQEYAIGRGVAAIRHRDEPALQPFVRGAIEVELPELLTQATGSTFPNISARQLAAVPYPNLRTTEQRAIARLLGALDDKIELNRRMSATLEAMARALFKSWFVDFEPVRAKAEGRPSGLPPALDALFPASFEASQLGEIPSGWDVVPAGQAVTVHGGSTPSTKEPAYWGGEHCFATPRDLSLLQDPILASTARRLTDAGLARIRSGLLRPGTVLLSSRAPIGYLAVTETPVVINQGIIAMVCDGLVGAHYALHWTRSNMDAIEMRASGTTFAEISKSSFRGIPFLVPPQPAHDAWESLVTSLYDHVASNARQSRSLASQRDALLPRLVSGEVRVVESSKLVRW